MSSKGILISKFFSADQQLEFVNELIQSKEYDEANEIIAFTNVDLSEQPKIIRAIYDEVIGQLQPEFHNTENDLEEDNTVIDIFETDLMKTLISLVHKIPGVYELLFTNIKRTIVEYITSNHHRLFNEEYYNAIVLNFVKRVTETPNTELKSTIDEEIVILLNFLERLFLNADKISDLSDKDLEELLLHLQGANIESIAVECAKLMRWVYPNIVEHSSSDPKFDGITWTSIQYIYNTIGIYGWKERNALCFQLRYLTVDKILSPELLKFIRKDEYWFQIQLALNNKVHENRKLGLSILKLTIQQLSETSETFNTKLFSWNSMIKKTSVESWKKFTTLYEIVALDTSINQIQAARQDILNLFKDDNIENSWNLILFSTGLHASMESVRKYVLSLVFQVENIVAFSTNIEILRDTILPAAMQAQFYNVYQDECSYGDLVSEFVSQLLLVSNNRSDILTSILELLIKEGTSFDPSRIYVSYGILKYLEITELNKLSAQNLSQLRKLFEFECEEEIFEMSLQTIYLKMLLYVENTMLLKEWLEALKAHILCVNYDFRYFSKMFEQLQKFATTNFDINSITVLENYDVLVYLLFGKKPEDVTNEFLIVSANSTLCDMTDFKDTIFERIVSILENPESTDELVLIDSIHDDKNKIEKLFNMLDNVSSDDKVWGIYRQYANKIISCHLKNIKDTQSCTIQKYIPVYDEIVKFYKNEGHECPYGVMDKAYASYLNVLKTGLETYSAGDSTTIQEVLSVVQRSVENDNGYFNGNLVAIEIISHILNNIFDSFRDEKSQMKLLKSLFHVIKTVWEDLTSERLVLKERSLHLISIETLFNSRFLVYATTHEDDLSMDIRDSLSNFGSAISILSYTRRGFLPLLSKQIYEFSKLIDDVADANYGFLIEVITSVFKQPQMPDNIFRLKPVIAKLYDTKLKNKSEEKVPLCKQIYGSAELTARTSIINAVFNFNDIFRKELIRYVIFETNTLEALKRIDGPEELERLLLCQLSLLSMSLMEDKSLEGDIRDCIFKSIKNEASPLVRSYKEWFMALIFMACQKKKIAEDQTSYLLESLNDHSQPITVVSAEKILYMSLKAMHEDADFQNVDNLLNKFMCALIPNASSNKPLVRHFSNSLMLSFWPTFKDRLESNVELGAIFENLYQNAKKAQIIAQFRAGDANIWNLYDLSLTNIFGGILKKTTDHDTVYISKNEFEEYLIQVPTNVTVGEDDESRWLSRRTIKGSKNPKNEFESSVDGPSPLQTKSGAWETVLDLDNKKSNESVHRSDLIVVSSLVDKPPNLGGICRLCDVLGVGLLTVQDIRVKNHPQFKNVAVTADKWMPMEEVPVDGITQFMKEKKKEGYTLIGLEQTDKSVKLDDEYKFPKKSLILLGTEAHGIPGDLLSELDLCLEIQQFGVIRSMNIQTATAVIVHSYTIQHM
ncbi:hypothetical protein C6P45_002136 [Maudiozyma exigua]|uniref:tRNA/rRNA methyltransferase SpoU type domain-containing protein n=1 Tax=Maudiozyma exigua TaxID=34358 RepID=A0A9P7BBK3_MAUEX|nr:hypothetical protein C6P45_002136 [Kazachstania exigua]